MLNAEKLGSPPAANFLTSSNRGEGSKYPLEQLAIQSRTISKLPPTNKSNNQTLDSVLGLTSCRQTFSRGIFSLVGVIGSNFLFAAWFFRTLVRFDASFLLPPELWDARGQVGLEILTDLLFPVFDPFPGLLVGFDRVRNAQTFPGIQDLKSCILVLIPHP